MQGWITIHRKIEENELWLSEPFTKGQAWVDLIMLANHTPKTIWKRGIKVVILRGEVGWSEDKLSKRWKWSRGKTRRYLFFLKTVQQIEHENNHTLSRIYIINYDKYQQSSTTDSTTDSTNNNNGNNVNNKLSDSSESPHLKAEINMWNKHQEEEIVTIDADTRETVKDPDALLKESNTKITHNLEVLAEYRGLPFGDLPTQRKFYKQILELGYTHAEIAENYQQAVESNYWQEQKKTTKLLPDIKTIYSNLKNKIK